MKITLNEFPGFIMLAIAAAVFVQNALTGNTLLGIFIGFMAGTFGMVYLSLIYTLQIRKSCFSTGKLQEKKVETETVTENG